MLINYASNVGGSAPTTRTGGASESIYIAPGITDYVNRFETVCLGRSRLLPQGSSVVGQRYQLVDPNGGSSARATPFPGGTTWTADSPQVTLHCRIGSASFSNVRSLDLKFFPDILQVKGEYMPDAAFRIALLAYFQTLNGFSFKGKDKTALPLKVVSIVEGVGGIRTITTTTPFTAAQGDVFRVSRAKTSNGGTVNGDVTIAVGGTGTAFVVLGWENVDTTGGTMKKISAVYPPFDPTSGYPVRTISKKVGGPNDRYRGRVSTRR